MRWDRIKEGERVVIEWGDAWNVGRQSDMMRELVTSSVGWVVDRNEYGIKISNEVNEFNDHRGEDYIPRKMVIKVTKI